MTDDAGASRPQVPDAAPPAGPAGVPAARPPSEPRSWWRRPRWWRSRWWRSRRAIVAGAAVVVLAGTAAVLLITTPWNDGARSTSAYCASASRYAHTIAGVDPTAPTARQAVLSALRDLDAHAPAAVRDDLHALTAATQALVGGDLSPVADPAKASALQDAAGRVDAWTSATCGVKLGA